MPGKNGGKGPPSRSEFSELQLEFRGLRKEVRAGFSDLRSSLNTNTGVLRQILKAVEHGNRRRDERVDDLEVRVEQLENAVGICGDKQP